MPIVSIGRTNEIHIETTVTKKQEINTLYSGKWWPHIDRSSQYDAPCSTQIVQEQFNSSPPSAVYMRRKTGAALLQVTVCRLLGNNADLWSMWPLGTSFTEIRIKIQALS